MGRPAVLKVDIVADGRPAAKGVKQADDALGKLGKSVGQLKALAGAALGLQVVQAAGQAGAALFGFAKDAVGAASDVNEALSKNQQLFGKSSKIVEAFAKTSARNFGISKAEALDAAGVFAVFGKSAGLSGDKLAQFSTRFIGLAADLASFNNTSPQDAIEAIGAALRGESEPLRRYGILLDDATLRQQALKLGLVKTTKEALTPQQKVLAAQAAIYSQVGDAAGDFGRTSDGLANSQRILKATFEDAKTALGEALLPAVTDLVKVLSSRGIPAIIRLTDKVSENKDAVYNAVVGFAQLAAGVAIAVGTAGSAYARFVAFALRLDADLVGGFLLMARQLVGIAAAAFGWVPGVGDKLRGAQRDLAAFQADAQAKLRGAANAADQVADAFDAGTAGARELRDAIAGLRDKTVSVRVRLSANVPGYRYNGKTLPIDAGSAELLAAGIGQLSTGNVLLSTPARTAAGVGQLVTGAAGDGLAGLLGGAGSSSVTVDVAAASRPPVVVNIYGATDPIETGRQVRRQLNRFDTAIGQVQPFRSSARTS